jgi:hypothetical protein
MGPFSFSVLINTNMIMPLFEKKYADYLTVYKIPIAPDQLDPTVFYFPETGESPVLLPAITTQIAKDMEHFSSNQEFRIKNYYLVGPATIPGSKNRSGELRIIIEINKQIMDIDVDGLAAEAIMKLAKQLSGKLATGTTRPIVYVPTVRPIEPSDYPGIYNIPKFQWLKLPNGVTK